MYDLYIISVCYLYVFGYDYVSLLLKHFTYDFD